MLLTATIRSRVEPELKNDAMEILKGCGLDLSTAIRLFLNSVVVTKGLPFEVVPNEKTVAAMEEARRLSARFHSPDELFEELEGVKSGKGRQTKTKGSAAAGG